MTSTREGARVTGALRRYRVMAIVTGSFLLLVTVGFLLKALDVVTSPTFRSVTTVIATIHGFIYIVYLLASGDLWMRARWGWLRLGALVLGGVIPGLSFFLERRVTKDLTNVVSS